MKILLWPKIFILLFFISSRTVYGDNYLTKSVNVDSLINIYRVTVTEISDKLNIIDEQILIQRRMLNKISGRRNKLGILLTLNRLESHREIFELRRFNEKRKIHFLKSIELIKDYYQRISMLEHYFKTISILSEIGIMLNPNNYDEYRKLINIVKSNSTLSFNLPSILEQNHYLSILHKLILIFGEGPKKKKSINSVIENSKCVIDMAFRGKNELSFMNHEINKLSIHIHKIKIELEDIFSIYASQVDYSNDLDHCWRNNEWGLLIDDFERMFESINPDDNGALKYELYRILMLSSNYKSFLMETDFFYIQLMQKINNLGKNRDCNSEIFENWLKIKTKIELLFENFRDVFYLEYIKENDIKNLLN